MKLIIAGPRDLYPSDETIVDALRIVGTQALYLDQGRVITGGASGVDACARRFAIRHALPTCEFEADWKKYGDRAELERDAKMLLQADALLVIKRKASEEPDYRNKIFLAEKVGMPVYIEEIEG